MPASKCRRQWGKISWTDRYSVRNPQLRSRSHPKISGLTEEYFKGVNQDAGLQFDLKPESDSEIQPQQPGENVSYQARCAQRWWAEFCRWLGEEQ